MYSSILFLIYLSFLSCTTRIAVSFFILKGFVDLLNNPPIAKFRQTAHFDSVFFLI